MDKRIRLRLLIVACLLFVFFRTNFVSAQIIQEIRIEGCKRVAESTITSMIGSSVGQDVDQKKIEEDIKQLYHTGFFDQITAKLDRNTTGKVILVFHVDEKPGIRQILLQGNKEVSDDTLKEKLNLGTRKFLDRRKIKAGVENAKAYYQEQGYYGTEIDFFIEPVEENQVDLTFVIKESQKQRIRKVVFEGNKEISSSKLAGVIDTSRYKWWSSWVTGSGVVKKEQLANDVKELSRYYLTHGYADVRVTDPIIEEIKNGLKVTYKISEGPLFNFGKVSASGTLLKESEQETLKGVASKTGDIFNLELLQKDTFNISEKYTDIGFAFANVEPKTFVNREAQIVDVDFHVDKGEVVRVDQILITGNQKTRDNVIRRTLNFNEQERYSSSKIRRSQELLQRLGYFDEVSITPDPSTKPDEVNLLVSVKEGSTGTFSAGAGISSGEGFIFSTRISENNLFGGGNSVAFDVNVGSQRDNFVLSFTNPRVNDSRWSFGTELLSVKREFDDFDRNQAGGSMSIGYPLWFLGPELLEDIQFSARYELLKINIDNVNITAPQLIKDNEGEATNSSITPKIVRNTIDNPLDPTKGSRQNLSVEFAGLGGDEKFWLLELGNTVYQPIWKSSIGSFIFSQRTSFGYGKSFNDKDFPLFRRFFAGGINSVRGFESRKLGPKDSQGNEFGGNKQLVGNFELIFPLIDSIGLRGVAFYDIGNAFNDDEGLNFSDLRQAVGWGIRWRSPLAPIRIEIGYPLDRESGDKSIVTNFSFGAPL